MSSDHATDQDVCGFIQALIDADAIKKHQVVELVPADIPEEVGPIDVVLETDERGELVVKLLPVLLEKALTLFDGEDDQ